MASTTIRVDTETHERLVELSEVAGASLIDTVRAGADALRRLRFAERVADELSALKEDSVVWDDYIADADTTSVSDGIG